LVVPVSVRPERGRQAMGDEVGGGGLELAAVLGTRAHFGVCLALLANL